MWLATAPPGAKALGPPSRLREEKEEIEEQHGETFGGKAGGKGNSRGAGKVLSLFSLRGARASIGDISDGGKEGAPSLRPTELSSKTDADGEGEGGIELSEFSSVAVGSERLLSMSGQASRKRSSVPTALRGSVRPNVRMLPVGRSRCDSAPHLQTEHSHHKLMSSQI